MDNVALSCLLAMANVAVSYCRDGLCRSGLWARCMGILTHSMYVYVVLKVHKSLKVRNQYYKHLEFEYLPSKPSKICKTL